MLKHLTTTIRVSSSIKKAFNLHVLKTSRWQWVDYLKGICILLVVYRHVLIGIERNGITIPQMLVDANMIFYSFRMPLFFILSGIFIEWSLNKRSFANLISKKLETLIYPYLIWSFIQITLQIVLSGHTNSERSYMDYLYILYQPQRLDQFWYLPALFNATFVFILIRKKIAPPLWLHAVISVALYFIADYFESISIISDWMRFYIFFFIGNILSKLIFKESTQKYLLSIRPFIITIPIFIAAQFYYLNNSINKIEFVFIALIGCFTMFLAAFRLQRWNILLFLRILGNHSLQIYVMHVIVAATFRLILTRFTNIDNPYILLTTGILFGVTIPIVFYNLLVKDNIGWFLFSPKKAVQKEYGSTIEKVVTT